MTRTMRTRPRRWAVLAAALVAGLTASVLTMSSSEAGGSKAGRAVRTSST